MQSTSSILMIRPVSFGFNDETAESNAFQVRVEDESSVQQKALAEFDNMVQVLRANGVDVHVVNDTPDPPTPDSIFPNNWISFHSNGTVYLYPMQAKNRRNERKAGILESLKERYQVTAVTDLSYFEEQNKYLEGTGSMVLDRTNKIAYACISPRTDKEALEIFCRLNGFRALYFHATDEKGRAIYHTNVMMSIGGKFALICMESVDSLNEKELLTEAFANTGKELIEISFEQMNEYAGNMLQLQNKNGEDLIVMSERAFYALTESQVQKLSSYGRLVYFPLQTIENAGGGSARCMIAEIYLPQLAP